MDKIFFLPVDAILKLKETAQKALHRLGLFNIRDLVFYRPYSYNLFDTNPNFSTLPDNTLIKSEVTILDVMLSRSSGYPDKLLVGNETGEVLLVFFSPIPNFILSGLKPGKKYNIAGNLQYYNGVRQITHPEFIFKSSLMGAVEPIYHLTYGLTNRQLYSYIITAIEVLELAVEKKEGFDKIGEKGDAYVCKLVEEIKQLHLMGLKGERDEILDTTHDIISEFSARELYANQLSLIKLKSRPQESSGRKFYIARELKKHILSNLGFKLTSSQEEAIKQIEQDQSSSVPMMRLLQGDVGSGKTLVALLTMLNVVYSGAQSALMVPTDLLSVQHYKFFTKSLEGTDIKVALLTGKTKAKEKKILNEQLEDGTINILIGTHALFQESVTFRDLGYVIIDEQHRFGVQQRLGIIAKANNPDVLAMTATPIPRSLTLTMFGDMSITSIKTKPKNRLPITTTLTSNKNRRKVIESLQKILDHGQKIYWVCPLIDPSDKTIKPEDDVAYSNVLERYDELSQEYKNQVGILHGKIKPNDKDALMQQFKDGAIKILVATTVIEVGIDVPDATLIIIENAEKFGLAQLHQLRGRVGRGELQSYCILMYEPKRFSETAKKRLEIMKKSNDGFYISEQDLKHRGGGEILGTKQSGEPVFFFADLGHDLDLLLQANKIAQDSQFNEFTEFQIKLFARDRQELAKSG